MVIKHWNKPAFAVKTALAMMLAILALFCMVRPASAEETTTSSVQIEIYMTDAWSGVEFSLTTSTGLSDTTYTVGEDGALTASVPEGSYYMFTPIDGAETPAMPDKVATTENTEVTGSSMNETEISVFLGGDWSGAVFNVATDLSVFPNGFSVDESGYLNVQVDDSSTYVISVATVADADETENTGTIDAGTAEAAENTEDAEETDVEETSSTEQTEDSDTAEESEEVSEDAAADAEDPEASEEIAEESEAGEESEDNGSGFGTFIRNNPFTLVYFVGLVVIIAIFVVLKIRNRGSEYDNEEYEDDDEEDED